MKELIGYTSKRLPKRFLAITTVFVITAFLVVEIWDGDIWWQVGIGRYILDHGFVPTIDMFSTAGFGRPYHDSHWLFQVIMAGADSILVGVQLVMIALWAGIFFLCYRSMAVWVESSLALPVLFLALIACSGRFTPRPDLVSFLMVMFFYFRLQQGRFRTFSEQIFLVCMQVLWSNSHGLFVLGPFMIGCYVLSEVISSGWRLSEDIRRLAELLLIVVLSTILTPFGTNGWSYAYVLFREGGLNSDVFFKGIQELKTPFSSAFLGFPDVWIFILLFGAFIITCYIAVSRKMIKPERFLIVFVFALLACNSLRNIPFFALTAAPFIAEHYSKLRTKIRTGTATIIVTGTIMILVAFIPISGIYYRYIKIQPRFGIGVAKDVFPDMLPQFLKKNRFNGPIYNSVDLGGFCLYHGLTPLFDSRWEVYLPDLLRELWEAPYEQNTWQALVNQFHFEGLLLTHGSHASNSLLPRLIADPGWKLVYADQVASFWILNSQRWAHVKQIKIRENAE